MKTGEKIVRLMNEITSLIFLILFSVIILYGIYCVWDSWYVDNQADTGRYRTYRPEEDDDLPFEGLKNLNSDVVGWLTVDGTNIDYPFVQGEDNFRYLNTDVTGEFAMSGSIFLDYRNKRDFSDVNNIIYGHHMKSGKMFGDLEKFQKEAYFDSHRSGKIYYEDQWHAIKFAAFLIADADDAVLYDAKISSEKKNEYLAYIQKKAKHFRKNELDDGEKYVLLSTCTSDGTGRRYVLIGKIVK